MTEVWREGASRSPACEADEHGSCTMWSPPDAGPPRLCKCDCHRRGRGVETAVAERAVQLGSESDLAADVQDRKGRNVRQLQMLGGIQLVAGVIGVAGNAKAFGVLLLATGGAALYTAAKRSGSAAR